MKRKVTKTKKSKQKIFTANLLDRITDLEKETEKWRQAYYEARDKTEGIVWGEEQVSPLVDDAMSNRAVNRIREALLLKAKKEFEKHSPESKLSMHEENEEKHLLQIADEMIYGEKEREHGDPARLFWIIAEFWNTYLELPIGTIKPDDVCQMMSLLKKGRYIISRNIEKDLPDDAGYIGLVPRVLK